MELPMKETFTKPNLKTRTIKVSDFSWIESQVIVKKFNMSREHYMNLANKLISNYFKETAHG
jgi:hypothetical protein